VSDPPRVLLVVANGGPGGMQVQVGLLARGLVDAGCDVAVACGPGDLDVQGAAIHRLPALTVRSAPAFGFAVRRAIADVEPDIVHGHGLRLAPVLALAAHARSLITCHGIDPLRVRRATVSVRLSRIDVAACGVGPQLLLQRAGIHARVLDNAVPQMPAAPERRLLFERFALADASLLAVSPARLSPQKDPLTLVRAIARCEDVSCVLLGGGPLEAQVRDEIRHLGLSERVAVSPWVSDARSVLAGADVLALSSRWEGQPTVMLEAMAAGVAIVATRCPGTAEMVHDGVSALLGSPEDPASLAHALERAKDPSVRAAIAEVGRTQVQRHELGVVTGQHLDAYRAVVDRRWP
jgi:glycosyltransferase involved in cell wall biosynthesis